MAPIRLAFRRYNHQTNCATEHATKMTCSVTNLMNGSTYRYSDFIAETVRLYNYLALATYIFILKSGLISQARATGIIVLLFEFTLSGVGLGGIRT